MYFGWVILRALRIRLAKLITPKHTNTATIKHGDLTGGGFFLLPVDAGVGVVRVGVAAVEEVGEADMTGAAPINMDSAQAV